MIAVCLQRLESFAADCLTAASRLLSSTEELLSVRELPRTVLEARSLLSGHEQHVNSVLQSASLSSLCVGGHSQLSQLQTRVEQFHSSAVVFR